MRKGKLKRLFGKVMAATLALSMTMSNVAWAYPEEAAVDSESAGEAYYSEEMVSAEDDLGVQETESAEDELGAQEDDDALFEAAVEEMPEAVAGVEEALDGAFDDKEAVLEDASAGEENPEGDGLETIESKGYENGAYVKWKAVAGAAGYRAYEKKSSATTWTRIDDELIRAYKDYWRVDALGLAEGSHDIKIEAVNSSEDSATVLASATVSNISVKTHDRHGFAFTGKQTPGAYQENGELKPGAKVLYVDNSNIATISLEVNKNAKGDKVTLGGVALDKNGEQDYLKSGLQGIVDSSGYWKYAQYNDNGPLVIRIIGLIDDSGFPSKYWASSAEGLQIKSDGKSDTVCTLEGVGDDATIKNFGILARGSSYLEISNLAVMLCADDSVSLDTDNYYSWVHNMDLFYGSTGGDADQAKGDGTVDVKGNSMYQTYSYNHFWDSGKCSLCGMKSESGPNYITYHHNWFDHSDSRHPRVRTMSVHVYNNFYDGISKYGAGAAYKSNIFVENNYFRNTKYPMMASLQGTDIYGDDASRTVVKAGGTFSGEDSGVIKAYNNIFEGECTFIPYGCEYYIYKGVRTPYNLSGAESSTEFDAWVAKTRSAKVPDYVKGKSGGSSYNNFDTDVYLGVEEADIDAPADVPSIVMAGAGRVNGGDFWYQFDDASDDVSYAVNTGLKSALGDYRTTLVSIGGFSGTVIDPGIQDLSRVPVTDADKTSVARYQGAELAQHQEDSYEIDDEDKSQGKSTWVYTEKQVFKASDFITFTGASAGSAADITYNGSTTIKYNDYFTLVKPRTVSKKTDRIALNKSGGSMEISGVEQGDSIRLNVSTAGGEGEVSYYALYMGGQEVESGKITGAAALSFDDLDAGDYSFAYDAEKTSTTGWIRIVDASICSAEEKTDGNSGSEEDTNDYTVTVSTGEGVSVSQAPSATYKKGAKVEFAAAVTAEDTTLEVSAVKANGTSVYVSYADGKYSFTMPASNVTISITAKAKSQGGDEPEPDPTEYYIVTFDMGTTAKTVSVAEGGYINFDDVPDMSGDDRFICWSTGTTQEGRVDIASYVVTRDVTLNAIYRSDEAVEIEDEFVASDFFDYLGVLNKPEIFGEKNSSGQLASAYNASGDYNPYTYGRFTFKDWKIPGKNTLNAIGFAVSSNGCVEIDMPTGATVSITGRTGGSGGKSWYTLTDESGKKYEAADSDGNVNMFTGNAATASAAKTITHKLGAAGKYTLAIDEEKVAADPNGKELRIFKITVAGQDDPEAGSYHTVAFKQGTDTLSQFTVAHGDFIDEDRIPTPSLSAGEVFRGWSASGDDSDAMSADRLILENILDDTVFEAVIDSAPEDYYDVTFSINENDYVVDHVAEGTLLESILPAVTPPAGKTIEYWAVNNVKVNVTSYAVNSSVTVTAVFKDVEIGSGITESAIFDLCTSAKSSTLSNPYFETNPAKTHSSVKELSYTDPIVTALKETTVLGTVDTSTNTLKYKTAPLKMSKDSSGGYLKFSLGAAKSNVTVLCATDKNPTAKGALTDSSGKKTEISGSNGVFKYTNVGSGQYTFTTASEVHVFAAIVEIVDSTSSYTVSVNAGSHVQTSLASGDYAPGTISFTASGEEGYAVSEVKAGDDVLTGEDGVYSFELKKNTTVTITAVADVSEKSNVSLAVAGSRVTGELPAGEYTSGTSMEFEVSALKGYADPEVSVYSAGNDVTAAVLSKTGDIYKLTVPDYEVEVRVVATAVRAQSVVLDPSVLNLTAGESAVVNATVTPAETASVVTWRVVNPASNVVCKVENGKITAVSNGEATVYAEIDGESASVKVNVSDIGIRSIRLSEDKLDMTVGEVTAVTAEIDPDNATNTKLVWTSSKPEVASVDGGRIVALTEGTTVIKAASEADGTVYAECTVEVSNGQPPVKEKHVTSISLNTDSAILMVGQTETLTVTYLPEDAVDTEKEVKWSSSKEEFATVKDGEVTAVAPGEAIITATLAGDENITASCKVTVNAKGGFKPLPTPVVDEMITRDLVIGSAKYTVTYPKSVSYNGTKTNIDDQVTIDGVKVGGTVSNNFVIKKFKYKDNKKKGLAKLTIMIKAAKGVKDKNLKREIASAAKDLKKNPITFEIVERDVASLKIEGELIYSASKGKWTSKLYYMAGGKKMKLKLNKNAAKSDFTPDAAYKGETDTVTITGCNNYKGSCSVKVTKK